MILKLLRNFCDSELEHPYKLYSYKIKLYISKELAYQTQQSLETKLQCILRNTNLTNTYLEMKDNPSLKID